MKKKRINSILIGLCLSVCISAQAQYSANDMNRLLDLYQSTYGTESPEYADCLLWCALICEESGDHKQTIQLVKDSDLLFEQYGKGPFKGRDTIQEIFRLDLMSKIEYNAQRDYFSIQYSKASSELKKLFFGSQNEVYLQSLLDLSKLYAERLDYAKSHEYHNRGYLSYVELIKREFCSRSESERTAYWASVKSYIDKTLDIAHLSAGGRRSKDKNAIAEAAYNAILLSKGLLLNTSIGFENYVMGSGNQEAIALFSTKKAMTGQGANQHALDSIDYVILDALNRQGQSFNIPHLSIGWNEVQQCLSTNDLAIEFYKTPIGEYGAILLKRNWTAPKIVHLKNYVSFKGKKVPLDVALKANPFGSFSPQNADSLWQLSQAIWTDEIIKYFPKNDVGNVYFAADGELLVTSIEHLPFVKPKDNGATVTEYHCLSDVFNMYRLSSTRELAMPTGVRGKADAVVFGGLIYDLELEQMESGASLGEQQRALRGVLDPIPYLEGTQIEAESIIHTIEHSAHTSYHVIPYLGEKGTEASFKALSGKQYQVIHVASHGFFFEETDSVSINKFGLGDNPLSHSGLFLSGADNKWLGDIIPDGVEDGFLTALEIASLDLRGLDLVVLSACETGKGAVNSDGVFGLQRGLKMASANSILMSLWKVDDDATCLLMTEFYKHWTEGKNKREAFELAKSAVRSHREKEWDNPRFWAAFILLDGLEK